MAPGRAGRAAVAGPAGDRYKWVALSNTTLAVFTSALDGSIVLIALPAIFRGIHLDPLAPANVSYLLWMIMGYRLVQAVLVVTLGRLGDIYGRVRIYSAGFVVFAAASVLLSFDPFAGAGGALWLIAWRVPQALGGSMLSANSAAILTDAFPREQRGLALGVNQVAAIAGQFIGLVAGGLLAALDWRAVFWVNVPVGVLGTLWAYRSLRETGERRHARIDWWGNLTFAVGLGALLIGVTQAIQPSAGHTMSWTEPEVVALLAGGLGLLAAFAAVERRVAAPMFDLALFRVRAFAAGSAAGLIASAARGGLQFVLIIWLQGIWLPLHGYSYAETPLWAGIYLLPLTGAFLLSGPLSGFLSDRHGARGLASAGMLIFGASFVGLLALPVDFPYWAFALLILAYGIGVGMFSAPNSSSIMGSVPAAARGAASGMRATFQNSGTALSIGLFFTLMIAGLSTSLPAALGGGLRAHGVPGSAAASIAHLPPVSSLFAAILGVNPVRHLLTSAHVFAALPAGSRHVLSGRRFFPSVISPPFHDGLTVVFVVAAGLSVLGALASLARGGRELPLAAADPGPPPAPRTPTPREEQAMTAPAHSAMRARVAAAGDALRADSPATAVHEAVAPQPGDIVVRKTRVGAFGTTPLDDELRERGITTLLLAGISTSGVVLSTVRDAADRDYRLAVLEDACADPEPDVHAFLVERIFPRQAHVVATGRLDSLLAP